MFIYLFISYQTFIKYLLNIFCVSCLILRPKIVACASPGEYFVSQEPHYWLKISIVYSKTHVIKEVSIKIVKTSIEGEAAPSERLWKVLQSR